MADADSSSGGPQDAIATVTQAIAADHQYQHSEAIALYRQGIVGFQTLLASSKATSLAPETKELISERVCGYRARVAQLEALMERLRCQDADAEAEVEEDVQSRAVVAASRTTALRWDALVGLDAAKAALRATMASLTHGVVDKEGQQQHQCVLLFGPPGTGKTALAHTLVRVTISH